MKELEQLGAQICGAQAQRRLSSDELAKKTKVAPNTISRARCGKGVSTRNFVKIVKALGGKLNVEFPNA